VAAELDGAAAVAPDAGTLAAGAVALVAGWLGWDIPRAARIVKNPVTLRPASTVRLAL
jgi:hypothetical protein